ncbi:cyclic nucleotide-binding domain-containing protein [Intrasporangium sp.]|uniref:cyclic nucleotide-binding domain-containing protein n=1 Tax=Intrasporangium sp. TaxID=1925024 RepID=UPI0033658C23
MRWGPVLTPQRGLQTGWGLTSAARLFTPVVLVVLAYERGGAGLLAGTSAALAVVGALMAAVVGRLGDRGHLGSVIRWIVVGSAAALALATLGALAQWSVLFVLALGVLSCGLLYVYRPLQAATLPWLVHTPRELAAANVASTAIESVASLAGPALAGAALLLLSPDEALGIGAVCLVLALLPVSRIHLPAAYQHRRVEPARKRSYAAGLGVLARVVRGGGAPVLVFAQTFARGALTVLLVILVLDELAVGDDVVGWLWAALGVGGLVGAAVGVRVLHVSRLGRSFVTGVVLWGAGLGVLSIARTPWLAALAMAVIGIGNALEDASMFTSVARLAPRGMSAQALGAIEIVACGGMATGAALAPAVVGTVDVQTALLAVGVALVVLAMLYLPSFRAVDRTAGQSQAATDLLTDVVIFEPLPVVIVEHLASRLEPHEYGPGDVVMREGEDGDTVHIIGSGTAAVTVGGASRPDLGPGDAFGEIALLRHSPRTATVTARGDLTTYCLDREDFLTAIQGSSASAEALADVRLARDASS